MDYCAACRRHINGALSCPGCGTPAHQLGEKGSGDVSASQGASADTEAMESVSPGRAERRRAAARKGGDAATRRSGSRSRTRSIRTRRKSRLLVGTLVGAAIVLVGWSVAELPLAGYVTGDRTQSMRLRRGAQPERLTGRDDLGARLLGGERHRQAGVRRLLGLGLGLGFVLGKRLDVAEPYGEWQAFGHRDRFRCGEPGPGHLRPADRPGGDGGSGASSPASDPTTAPPPPPPPSPTCTRFLWWCS